MTPDTNTRRIALMLDFDNIILGLRNNAKFKPKAIVERVLEVGKVVVKRAYADWSRYEKPKIELHGLGFDLLEIPKRSMTGKNSADIRMVVDAMDLVISREHIDTFALVTGDSDFTPLVSALREHDKQVIGIGMRDSSSKLLIESCDEFVFYEELEGVRTSDKRKKAREQARDRLASKSAKGPKDDKELSRRRAEALVMLLESTTAIMRNSDSVWASQVKQTMVRKHPSFSESYHGYPTFSKLVEHAVELGILEGARDAKSGNWRLTGIGETAQDLRSTG